MDEDDDLKKQVEETLKYLSFSLKQETDITGSVNSKYIIISLRWVSKCNREADKIFLLL